jgi:hypothetical protein
VMTQISVVELSKRRRYFSNFPSLFTRAVVSPPP